MPVQHRCSACGSTFSRPPSVKPKFCSRMCKDAASPRRSLADRFWEKIWIPDDPDACWEWTGSTDTQGYGHISEGGRRGKLIPAHVVSWQLDGGEIPEGLELDHLCHGADTSCIGGRTCRHRRCVNPRHLEPVTHQVNGLRGRSFASANAQKTHCPSGHLYTEDSLPRTAGSQYARVCRTCKRERDALRQLRRRDLDAA